MGAPATELMGWVHCQVDLLAFSGSWPHKVACSLVMKDGAFQKEQMALGRGLIPRFHAGIEPMLN